MVKDKEEPRALAKKKNANPTWCSSIAEKISQLTNVLSVGFHVELLKMGCEAEKGLGVREDGASRKPKKVAIPHADCG